MYILMLNQELSVKISKFSELNKYKDLLENAILYYYNRLSFLKHFKKFPKFRYYSYDFALNYIKDNNLKSIIELGTIRSYVDGRFEGCNSDDKMYWDENNPEKWDWSAGMFSYVFSECLPNCSITTVDNVKAHLERCKHMNIKKNNIKYVHKSSEEFLKSIKKPVDVIYIDTGDLVPVEENALNQLLEAHLIVDRKLINKNGLVIIDDILSPQVAEEDDHTYGKSKYTVPYLLENGFEIIYSEYQIILKKIN